MLNARSVLQFLQSSASPPRLPPILLRPSRSRVSRTRWTVHHPVFRRLPTRVLLPPSRRRPMPCSLA